MRSVDNVRPRLAWWVLAIGAFLLAGGGACTSQAAITVGPGTDYDFSTIQAAIDAARNYLRGAMENAYPVGNGVGPVNHGWKGR